MDGELGAPRSGAPTGTQAQQNRVLGDRAGCSRHGSSTWHFLDLALVPKAPRLQGAHQLLNFVSRAIADHTHLLKALSPACTA